MNAILSDSGGSVSLADMPKAITARLQRVIEPDYSYDKSWVEYCLELGVLPASSLAAKAVAAGLSPFTHCRAGGGLVE